jgi:hypothetical protein
MPRKNQSKYSWPASAITESDLDILYRARESTPERIPITQLLAHAVRKTYGHLRSVKAAPMDGTERREAA